MFLLGLDIGSSSIKAALVNVETGQSVALQKSPEVEMSIDAPQIGWAEQDPNIWWKHSVAAIRKIFDQHPEKRSEVKAIGISYQMHGLVLYDQNMNLIRPSIIWCDGRAVKIGEKAFKEIGQEYCLSHYLNSPGNFTASKLAWVKENEPEKFDKVRYFSLPGDFLAFKLTGQLNTTVSGLSEGIFWDFKEDTYADNLLAKYQLSKDWIPPLVPTFANQGKLSQEAAVELGLTSGIPITYRAGDQPNNALSLGVLNPGEVAATGGTSGVVYGIVDQPKYDPQSRVNGFAHVNHIKDDPRIGILLCINGVGIQYNWMRQVLGGQFSYGKMEELAAEISPGAEGLSILSFGNGPERMLANKDIGSQILGLNFNVHKAPHLIRATLEGIAFGFVYGMNILKEMGMDVSVMKVGNDNLFQSTIFSQTLSNLIQAEIQVNETTGAVGAALAAGVGIGLFQSPEEAVAIQVKVNEFTPESQFNDQLQAYDLWLSRLNTKLQN
ncbi:MAG: FGGY family carbohydrate kinase [Bacteroidia bacterium]|nr:FGGY family carbohydrate kinase [Bacteroidia bacterium]